MDKRVKTEYKKLIPDQDYKKPLNIDAMSKATGIIIKRSLYEIIKQHTKSTQYEEFLT